LLTNHPADGGEADHVIVPPPDSLRPLSMYSSAAQAGSAMASCSPSHRRMVRSLAMSSARAIAGWDNPSALRQTGTAELRSCSIAPGGGTAVGGGFNLRYARPQCGVLLWKDADLADRAVEPARVVLDAGAAQTGDAVGHPVGADNIGCGCCAAPTCRARRARGASPSIPRG
jgi:hypothetical protein